MDGTIFGGALTVILIMIVATYMVYNFIQVWQHKESVEHNVETIIPLSDDSRLDVTLGQFEDSLNFVLGIDNYDEDFDIHDNRFFEVVGYELELIGNE